jgi:hypothetical protein
VGWVWVMYAVLKSCSSSSSTRKHTEVKIMSWCEWH